MSDRRPSRGPYRFCLALALWSSSTALPASGCGAADELTALQLDSCPSGGGVAFFSYVTWSNAATASSSHMNFDPTEATGEPNCFDSKGCLLGASGSGDCARAWTFDKEASAADTLDVQFPSQSAAPSQLFVYETYAPDGLGEVSVTYVDGSSETLAHVPAKESVHAKLLFFRLANKTKSSVKTVRLTFNQSSVGGFTYIDAVGVR